MSSIKHDKKVTVVITSCNRPNELKITLESFLKFNTYPIEVFVFIEDGGSDAAIKIAKQMLGTSGNIFIKNDANLGQLNSIDKAYQYVQTEFIFHMEDDWRFCEYGFIEKSIYALDKYQNVIYLSLRSMRDQNGHPFVINNDEFHQPKPFWKGVWVGYGFNPSLRRLKDYIMIGSSYGEWNQRETSIGIFYFINRMRVALLPGNMSYVEHIGSNCSTGFTHKKA